MSESDSEEDACRAVVLDYLPHGRSDDDRPQYQRSAVAYGLDPEDFRLFEFAVDEDADVTIGDRVVVEPADQRTAVEYPREIEYDDLSSGATSEVEYVVEEVVEDDEERFVEVYNEAGPITLRLHQLDLLPGIGEKLRNSILDERKRGPFEDFADVEQRVDGLHDPEGTVVDRVMEELRGEDLKYRIYAQREEE